MTRDDVLSQLDSVANSAFAGSVVSADVCRAAAEIIRASGWRPIAEAPELVDLLVGGWVGDEWDTDLQWKHSAIECGYTHYLPQPAPPAREVGNDGE